MRMILLVRHCDSDDEYDRHCGSDNDDDDDTIVTVIVMMWQEKQCSINSAGPRCGKATGDSTYKTIQ